MVKYVDETGLGTYTEKLAEKLDSVFVKKEEGKTLSSNDYTTADKEKLAGIDSLTNEEIDASFASE